MYSKPGEKESFKSNDGFVRVKLTCTKKCSLIGRWAAASSVVA